MSCNQWFLGEGEIPSIWLAVAAFAFTGIGAMRANRQIFRDSLITALLMGLMALVGYAVDFLVDGDAFLQKIWLLHGTKWDIRVSGNVPLDEVMWNVTRAWCVFLLFLETSGTQLVPRRASKK